MVEFVILRLVLPMLCGMSLSALLFLSSAHAQALNDPTRPPDTVGSAEEINRGPVLQSILVGAGRREAIINGRTVKVGEQLGEARVVSIGDSEVVLRSGGELQTLKLFPAIEKQMTASRNGTRAGMREQEK